MFMVNSFQPDLPIVRAELAELLCHLLTPFHCPISSWCNINWKVWSCCAEGNTWFWYLCIYVKKKCLEERCKVAATVTVRSRSQGLHFKKKSVESPITTFYSSFLSGFYNHEQDETMAYVLCKRWPGKRWRSITEVGSLPGSGFLEEGIGCYWSRKTCPVDEPRVTFCWQTKETSQGYKTDSRPLDF